MEYKVLLYILIGVIFVVSKIYQGLKKAKEEQLKRQEENAKQPTYTQPQQTAQRTPDTWTQPQSSPAPVQRKADTSWPASPTKTEPAPRPKTIEEILQEMTRQHEPQAQPQQPQRQPQAPPQRQPQAQTPMRKLEQLDNPYSTIDSPTSTLDKPNAPLSKNYKFDESTATRSLSAKSYTNILEEDDTLDQQGSMHLNPFNPREAYKYAVLLERKYE